MNLKEAMAKLESMGDEKRRAFNLKPAPHGIAAGKLEQFGVAMGDLRKLAAKIKPPHDHALALDLWRTRNIDAQLLAILIMKPKELSTKEVDAMVRQATFSQVADWFNAYIVKELSPADKETLRIKWMKDKPPDGWAARAGWNLTASRINKGATEADGIDAAALLDRIEKEMPRAKPETQWTLNNTLMAIGVRHAELRKRAIAIGEKIGLYKDWPVSKGCTIPYAPTAIPAMAKMKLKR